MKINLADVETIDDFRAVPPGEYRCKAAEVRESDSPAGHVRWGIRWEVVGGDYNGRTACWDSLHWSERGMPRSKFILQMLGFKSDAGAFELEPADLVGREAYVTIATEEREDPISGIRRLTNRVPFAGYSIVPDID